MSDKRLITDPADVRRGDQQSIPACVTRHESAGKPRAGTVFAGVPKGFTLALAMIASVAAAPGLAAADEAPIAFIRDLGNQALAVIRADMPLASKAAYFERMV